MLNYSAWPAFWNTRYVTQSLQRLEFLFDVNTHESHLLASISKTEHSFALQQDYAWGHCILQLIIDETFCNVLWLTLKVNKKIASPYL